MTEGWVGGVGGVGEGAGPIPEDVTVTGEQASSKGTSLATHIL